MNRNRRIFIVVFLVFTALVILLTIDMARRTTAPWNKHKQVERALPGEAPAKSDVTAIDTLVVDSAKGR